MGSVDWDKVRKNVRYNDNYNPQYDVDYDEVVNRMSASEYKRPYTDNLNIPKNKERERETFTIDYKIMIDKNRVDFGEPEDVAHQIRRELADGIADLLLRNKLFRIKKEFNPDTYSYKITAELDILHDNV